MVSEAEKTLSVAGFALAHALWSISDGEQLCTLALAENDMQQRILYRFETDTIPQSLDAAVTKLTAPDSGDVTWAIVFDAFYTFANRKRDALVVVPKPAPDVPFRVVQQYAPASKEDGFRVIGRPILLESDGAIYEDERQQTRLLMGLHQHQKVHELWQQWQKHP